MKKRAAGYSGTPLPQKLGIKPGMKLVVLGAPWPYSSVVAPLSGETTITTRLPATAAFIHCFLTRAADLTERLPRLSQSLADAGTLWISWPKRTSGVKTDLTEDVVRRQALAIDLVDVKVCAVDEVWSGLKLVRRAALRAAKGPAIGR